MQMTHFMRNGWKTTCEWVPDGMQAAGGGSGFTCCVRLEFVPTLTRADSLAKMRPLLSAGNLRQFSYPSKRGCRRVHVDTFSDRTQCEPAGTRARRTLEHSPFILFPNVVFFREVHKVNHRLGSQKQIFVQHFDL